MGSIIGFLKKGKASFCTERVICRLLASFCTFWAWGLVWKGGFDLLSYQQDLSLATLLGGVLFFFIAYSSFHLLLKTYETDSWFLFFAATVCVIGWVMRLTDFLFVLAVAIIYCMLAVWFVWKNEALWQKWKPGKTTVWCAAAVFALICGGVIGAIGCLRYATFSAPNFDFGIFVNMMYHMKESGLPLCTCERDVMMSHFAVHLSPIWYVLLPFYAIFPSPLTLQIGQAVALASGVIPVVLICRSRKLSNKSTIFAALIYSLYPVLATGCFYDIHENCFLTPLLLWMFCFFERKQYIPTYVFAALTLMVKEDAAIYVLFFALYIIFAEKKYRHGLLLAVGALLYFSVALGILEKLAAYYTELHAGASPNPSIDGPMIDRYDSLIYDPKDGLFGALKTALVNPGYLLKMLFSAENNSWEKVIYFLKMLLPVGFLPFFTKKASRWILIAPILMNLITDYPYQYQMNYQYHFGIAAFLIYAALLNLSELHVSFKRSVLAGAAALCCCLYVTTVLPALGSDAMNWTENRDRYTFMEEILATIPEDASVSCSHFLLPHLAERDEVYEIYYHDGETDVDYVIFDARSPIDQKDINGYLRRGYVILEEYEDLLIILVKEEK